MPINAHPDYLRAEKEYIEADNVEDRLACLENMIRHMPQHKGAENLRAGLRLRYKKLKEKIKKSKKSGRGKRDGIKKADMQCLVVGFPNVGKSLFFQGMTGQKSKIVSHAFSTYEPVLGTFVFEDVKVQIIDTPSFPNIEGGLINTTDLVLLIVDSIEQIKKANSFFKKSNAEVFVIFNKCDLLNDLEKRKINATLKSKYNYDFVLLSSLKPDRFVIGDLKKRIFHKFPVVRIYTKEPKKKRSVSPMVMKVGVSIKDVAEKILKGFSLNIRRVRVWGPSSKFGGQVVGLDHLVKDKDVVEFQTF